MSGFGNMKSGIKGSVGGSRKKVLAKTLDLSELSCADERMVESKIL